MARIRTIKPEFPQSESMGRVSRDARLLFIELWTLCDDEGRTRGNSRMLASLLFPYDDDAPKLIDGWISELEKEACVIRYFKDDATYIQVCNWLNHQKIDKPSKSKIPEFTDDSRILANPRELSSEDQGSRIKDQGIKDRLPPTEKNRPVPPSASPIAKSSATGSRLPAEWVLPKQWGEWALETRPELCADDVRREADNFRDHWISQVGAKGRKADWLATWRKWIRSDLVKATGKGGAVKSSHWFMSSTGIEAKGVELGIKQEPGEVFPNFRNRIYRAAGVTDEMVRKAKIDAGERV